MLDILIGVTCGIAIVTMSVSLVESLAKWRLQRHVRKFTKHVVDEVGIGPTSQSGGG